jgi:hypothetical protein
MVILIESIPYLRSDYNCMHRKSTRPKEDGCDAKVSPAQGEAVRKAD